MSAASQERNVLLATGVAHAATHYAELTYPTLAVALAAQTGRPIEQVLSWSFAGYLLFGLGALPAGLLADRLGARRLMLLGMTGVGAAFLLAAAARPGLPLAAALGLLGLSASVYHPAGMGLITRTVRARGRALAVNGIWGNLGIAATPLVTAALAQRLGWRGALVASGGVLLAATAVLARLPIEEPAPDHAPAAHVENGGGSALPLAILCVAAMLGGISYRGNTLAQPAFFAERVSLLGYGAATSLVYLVGIAGQYAGGRVADRHDLRFGYLAFQAATVLPLLAMGFAYDAPLLGAAAAYVFFGLGMQPLENSLFAHLTPPRWRSTGYGLKFILTFGVGSIAVWLVDWTKRARGLAAVFPVLAGVELLLVLAIVLLIVAMGRRSAPAPQHEALA